MLKLPLYYINQMYLRNLKYIMKSIKSCVHFTSHDYILVNTSILTNWVQIESLKPFFKTIQVGHNNFKFFSFFLWSWNMFNF
jgi:hypothetical protein